jgi:hypothetical protein
VKVLFERRFKFGARTEESILLIKPSLKERRKTRNRSRARQVSLAQTKKKKRPVESYLTRLDSQRLGK